MFLLLQEMTGIIKQLVDVSSFSFLLTQTVTVLNRSFSESRKTSMRPKDVSSGTRLTREATKLQLLQFVTTFLVRLTRPNWFSSNRKPY